MNDIHSRRSQNLEKPFPGCMGRVVNLLDFGPRMTANKLLTDKAHSDDLAKKAVDPIKIQQEEKTMPYELRKSSSKKKSNGTPMKMLIAHEMSKEIESKQKPSNLVAKLMGLDALPEQQPDLTSQKSQTKRHTQNTLSRSGTPPRCVHHEGSFHEKQMQTDVHPFQDQKEYKDVYEVWQESPKTSYVEHKSRDKGRHSEKVDDRGMDLVRQKFTEAKRLAADENDRQSKEFQEALEVLSSNKDLFLKFLQEPNSLFSQHLYELKSNPSLPQTKRITVLRPSKSVGNDRFVGYEDTCQIPMKRESPAFEANIWDKSRSSPFHNQKNDSSTHPTRIVVLKPSPGMIHDIKTVASSPALSPSQLHSKDYYEELDDDDAQTSREVAKEITQKMRETLRSYPREDTMLSSVLSNGYVGDESSFNKSDNEYAGEGNLSDSEIMTPTSRMSWDYVNKLSPYSSSFSRASYSPESSVCREAKKRLSERWAMMASNGNGEEQRQVRRSSSTLGEMLALSETKKLARSGVEKNGEVAVSTSRSLGGEQEFRAATSCLSSSDKKDEADHDSPKNLLRSRSVPVSSTTYGSRLNVEVPSAENSKANVPTELEKSKSAKSSFKGKVSSLFFSKNKKQNKDKLVAPSLSDSQDNAHASIDEQCPVNETAHRIMSCGHDEGPSLSSNCTEPNQGAMSHEAALSGKVRSLSEISDQPSPISVLEAPFEEEDTTPQSFSRIKADLQGSSLLHESSLKSNLIAKSPPIGSLARSLSWDDAPDLATPVHSNYSMIPSETDEDQEWLLFIQKLLSSAGTDNADRVSSDRWHTPDCPLDPKLFEKFANVKEDSFQWHDIRRRQQRSKQKLIFDSVNEALVDVIRCKTNTAQNIIITAEEVWSRMREWFSGDNTNTKWFPSECEDRNSLIVDIVVKKEVVGKGWMENMKTDMDGIGKEIEGKVLDELVEDALFELTGRFR
ncbi:hypothetical protein ACHQM5_013978 [Ranunculus cassubicifolius]